MADHQSAAAAAAAAATKVPREEAIWSKDDHDWALTYNIWYMLPWMERKEMASKYGCKSIGEFEEYMSMRRVLEEEKKDQKAYPNEDAYIDGIKQKNQRDQDKKPAAIQEEEETEPEDVCIQTDESTQEEPNPDDELTPDELLKAGGKILSLPEELVHTIFSWLSVDAYASLALVSPHWKHLSRVETVFRKLCERIYLHQSKRRILNLARFGSYRNMLFSRPRVRTGLYVMRYAQVCVCMCLCVCVYFKRVVLAYRHHHHSHTASPSGQTHST
jgi:hypothetical protein